MGFFQIISYIVIMILVGIKMIEVDKKKSLYSGGGGGKKAGTTSGKNITLTFKNEEIIEISNDSTNEGREIFGYFVPQSGPSASTMIKFGYGGKTSSTFSEDSLPKDIVVIPFHTHPKTCEDIICLIEPPSPKDIFLYAAGDEAATRKSNVIISNNVIWIIDFEKSVSELEASYIADYSTIALSILTESIDDYNAKASIERYNKTMSVYLSDELSWFYDIVNDNKNFKSYEDFEIIPNVKIKNVITHFLQYRYKRAFDYLSGEDYDQFKNIITFMLKVLGPKKNKKLFDIKVKFYRDAVEMRKDGNATRATKDDKIYLLSKGQRSYNLYTREKKLDYIIDHSLETSLLSY